MIALLRSTDGQPDSRFEKYTQYLMANKVPYITLCWDRYGVKNSDESHLFYKKPSKYGLRFKNVAGLLGFNWFLVKTLIKRRKEYNVIHAADFDTIIPAMILKLLCRKKVIYDIYDWYIDSRSIKNKVLKWFITKIEYLNVTKSDVVIICEEGRKEQILFEPKQLWILPNIPHINAPNSALPISENLKINYVGILGEGRGLLNLIKIAEENPKVQVKVGGFGPLESDFQKASSLPNLEFLGRVNYDKALEILSSGDLIYAMYERINPNHILAAPNKFYESLALGRPIITTVGTLVGNKVEKYNTGYCLDEKLESLENLVNNADIEDIKRKSQNSKEVWNNMYKDYVPTFMNQKYIPFIKDHNE